jgi:hypothetical protein
MGRAVSDSTVIVKCSTKDGLEAQGLRVTLRTSNGVVSAAGPGEEWGTEATALTDDDGVAIFGFSGHWYSGANPGVVLLEALAVGSEGSPERDTVEATLVGPPAFLVLTASPANVVCGERSTILATVTDALNQRVADETPIRFDTNHGGEMVFRQAKTYGGIATTMLLTSEVHAGSYVVAAHTVLDPPGTPPVLASLSLTAVREAQIERTQLEEIADSLQEVRVPSDPEAEPERRVAKTFMFTDIVGSTALNARLGN